jgi:hypothetical protein
MGGAAQQYPGSFEFYRCYSKLTGIQFQEVYNIMLRRGWTLGTAQLIPLMHVVIRMFYDEQVRALERHWSTDPPDMVVSLIPNYNRVFKQALSRACPAAPLVTILTDIAITLRTSGSSARISTSSAGRTRPWSKRSPWDTPRRKCFARRA